MSGKEDYDFIHQLIECVKAHRCLYEKRDTFYFNRIEKNKAWNDIAEKCNKTTTECRYKWKYLRERYSRELRKPNLQSSSGSADTNDWELSNEMAFLRSSMKAREKPCKEEFEEEISICFSDDSTPGPSSSSTAKRRKNSIVFNEPCDQYGNIVQKLEERFAAPIHANSISDGDVEFLSAILPLMRDLPIEAKDEFKAEMMTRLVQIRKECRHAGSLL